MSSIFGKSALSLEWAERFREIAKLNAYAQSTPVRLSDVVIAGYNLSGAKLSGAEFDKVEWKKVTLKSGEFTNTKFIHSSFDEVVFENVLFKDTVFEDSTFDASTFFQAELQNVRFVRCQFKNAGLESLKASVINIEDSTLEDASFYRSAMIATVRGSKFNDVDMRSLQASSALTFAKSELKEVKFDRAILEQLTFIDSKIVESGGSGAVIDHFVVTRTSLDFGLAESRFKSVVISGSALKSMGLGNDQIQELEISDCTQFDDLGLYETKLSSLKINRCAVNGFRPRSATIDTWSVKDSQIANSKFEGMKVRTATLENVTLDKELNFTNAHIDQLTTKNITKLPGLNLITTGSNVKFD